MSKGADGTRAGRYSSEPFTWEWRCFGSDGLDDN
jgi:hypothetical protein